MPRINDFMGLRNRRPVKDWGWDGETNDIASDSSMMIERSRVKTETHYEENPKYTKMVRNAQEKSIPKDYSVSSVIEVTAPCDLKDFVRSSMGKSSRGTIYKT